MIALNVPALLFEEPELPAPDAVEAEIVYGSLERVARRGRILGGDLGVVAESIRKVCGKPRSILGDLGILDEDLGSIEEKLRKVGGKLGMVLRSSAGRLKGPKGRQRRAWGVSPRKAFGALVCLWLFPRGWRPGLYSAGPSGLKHTSRSVAKSFLLFSLTSCILLFMEIPRLSPKEALILRLLVARGEMYGLALVAESGGELKRGTVYVTLGRMADKGYVESRQIPQDDGSGMPKRLFQATGYGTRVLKAWELASSSLGWEGA